MITEVVRPPAAARAGGRRNRAIAPLMPATVALATTVLLICALVKGAELPFWRDEVFTVAAAHRPIAGTLAMVWGSEGNQALYYLFMNGWLRFGTSELWARLPTILCAAAAIPATALLGRRLFGDMVGGIAAILLALNLAFIELAFDARAYAPMLLLAVLSMLLFIRAVERGGRRAWVAYAIAATAMVYLGVLTVLVLFAQVLSLIVLPRSRRPGRAARPGLAGLVLALTPAVLYVVFRNGESPSSWILPTHLSDLTSVWTAWAGSTLLGVLFALAAAGGLYAGIRVARDTGDGYLRWRYALVGCWLATPLALFAFSMLVEPVWQERYVVWSLPPLLFAVALGIDRLPRRGLAMAAAAVVTAAVALNLAEQLPRVSEPENLRAAADVLLRSAHPGDGVAYAPAFARLGVRYYLVKRAHGRPLPADVDARPGAVLQGGDQFVAEDTVGRVTARLPMYRRLWIVAYPGDRWHPTPEPFLAAEPVARRTFKPLRTWRWGQLTLQLVTRGSAR